MWTYSQKNATSEALGTRALFDIFEDLYGLDGELPPPHGK